MTSTTSGANPQRPSRIQRLLITILAPRLAADMEADSRAWYLRCDKCGFEQSIWEIGGVRWKAVGNSRNYRKCGTCGQRSWQRLLKRPSAPPGGPS